MHQKGQTHLKESCSICCKIFKMSPIIVPCYSEALRSKGLTLKHENVLSWSDTCFFISNSILALGLSVANFFMN